MKTKFVSLEDVLVIHEMVIEFAGGKQGVRDFILFHSAISRPQATFGGRDLYPTIFDKAAALTHSLLLNHPFLDGNKRTALIVCERFLEINGYIVNTTQKEKVKFTLDIENKSLKLDQIAGFLKTHTRKK